MFSTEEIDLHPHKPYCIYWSESIFRPPLKFEILCHKIKITKDPSKRRSYQKTPLTVTSAKKILHFNLKHLSVKCVISCQKDIRLETSNFLLLDVPAAWVNKCWL